MERRFTRTLLVAMIATAVAVAMLGLAERAWWNGRILWRYVPEDWPGPWLTEAPRSSGPFVNPDHFANYLAMTLPLAVLGIAFACPWAPGKHTNNTRAVSACAALVIAVALALSLSRAGWLAAATGAYGAVALCLRFARADAPTFLRRLPVRTTPLTIAGFAILLAVVVYLMGPTGRIEAGHRIALTSAGELAQNRRENWSDTLRMIERFPIAGIGLGCWPDLFPQFQSPPWQPIFFREAENDYLQFIAETGLVGLALLVWFACVVGVRITRAARSFTPREWQLFAGLLGGLGAVVLHEAFDFSLHTPANALLFTMLLALLLRITVGRESPRSWRRLRDPLKPTPCVPPWTAGVALVAMALIIPVQVQDGAAYPYRIGMRATLAEAEAQVAYHPAVAAAHLVLSAMMPADTPNKFSSAELYAAVVLDPNDPQARDLYASGLLLAGEKSAGLRQIALSVYHAPRRELHPYLSARSLPWLLPDEQMAIAQGFERAIGAGFDQALDQCTVFYTTLGRYRDLANLYVRVARTTPEGPRRMNREVTAGHNYALAGDSSRATEILHEARETDPSGPAPYIELVTSVIGPTGDFRAAQRTVDEGIQSGADPYSLELALASVAV
jgi:O-antigen ligase